MPQSTTKVKPTIALAGGLRRNADPAGIRKAQPFEGDQEAGRRGRQAPAGERVRARVYF